MTLTLYVYRRDPADEPPAVRAFDGGHLSEVSCYHVGDRIQREGRTYEVQRRTWTADGGLSLDVLEVTP